MLKVALFSIVLAAFGGKAKPAAPPADQTEAAVTAKLDATNAASVNLR